MLKTTNNAEIISRDQSRAVEQLQSAARGELIDTRRFDAVHTLLEHNLVDKHIDLLQKVVGRYSKPYENIHFTGKAVIALYNSKSEEARAAIFEILKDIKIHHTPRQFILQRAARDLLTSYNFEALKILEAGINSKNPRVQDVAVSACEWVIKKGSLATPDAEQLIKSAFKIIINQEKQKDIELLQEHSAIETVKVLARTGAYKTILNEVETNKNLSETV